jgi:hypothetical protein
MNKKRDCATLMTVLFSSFILFGASTDSLEIITSCGESTGYSYYLKTEMTKDNAGWTEDSISSSDIIFITRAGQPDILMRDARQKTYSKKESGAHVQFKRNSFLPSMYTVYVIFPEGDMEHYIFNLDKSGNGEVVWGSIRGESLLPKSSIYNAKCKK